jgi:hypothetical protein
VSTTDTANTVLSGPGLTNAIAGDLTSFTVTLYDSGNNQRTSGGDNVVVTITSTSYNITAIQVTDNNKGTYTVNYIVTDATPIYTITVIVNGNTANEKTSTLTVVANNPNPLLSVLTATSPVTMDTSITYTINALDSWSNIV